MTENLIDNDWTLCDPVAEYSRMLSLFPEEEIETEPDDIRVVELFAGVGGFRIGLERASKRFKTIWNNQWEPSTKRQDASIIYCHRFGLTGHSNKDINTVDVDDIPASDLLVGGFPCQDYSVAATLSRSGGIEGKKGVLWWQIHRILRDHKKPPKYLMLENVDRLLGSPAFQRGRDFAIILASLADLGYCIEWRVINAADYGMPQKRRRTYMFGYHESTPIANKITSMDAVVTASGIMEHAFPTVKTYQNIPHFRIEGNLKEVSDRFNCGKNTSPFLSAGFMCNREVATAKLSPLYDGPAINLGDILIDENLIPSEFFIPDSEIPKWAYAKGSKSEMRVDKKTGYEYKYSEGAMAFPDYLDRPSRTIITSEGGAAPSRFKHIILTPSGRYRRLVPIELERLNMFPDNHTIGSTDTRRAFLMGNALVTGIVERIGRSFLRSYKS
ncbi:MAG: DNA (cytosine-5-)-methyltransferase [Muribaculaceae bacterium]